MAQEGVNPLAGAVEIALGVIANEAQGCHPWLFTLWNEFNGHGPKSEMWWFGDMETVAENFGYDERPRPSGPDDLLSAMGFNGLSIRESLYGYKKPFAELTFSAGFEPEHGIGILTDGRNHPGHWLRR